MPIKVMYVLGTGSKHDNQELRWSLRSLEKFCQDDIEPVIVGSVPDWFTGEFVKCDDKTPRKNINILHKVCKGIESGIVKGEFLFSSDDHILVNPYSFEKGPRWIKNPMLKALPESGVPSGWNRLTDATLWTLLGCGYPAIDFEQHFNTYMNTEVVGDVLNIVEYAESHNLFKKGILVPSVFNNAAIANGDHRPMGFKKDYKLDNVSKEDLDGILAEEDCYGISISDKAFESAAFMECMKEMFPKKSKWEK